MTRREKLAALAAVHDEWQVRSFRGAYIHFDPSRANVPDSDYNQHHVDIDASAAAQDDFHQRAAHIFGMDT